MKYLKNLFFSAREGKLVLAAGKMRFFSNRGVSFFNYLHSSYSLARSGHHNNQISFDCCLSVLIGHHSSGAQSEAWTTMKN